MTDSISSSTRIGAFRPGMSAVVTMMSTSFAWSSIIFACAFLKSSDISLAYPPVPEPSSSMGTSKNVAPMLSTCSFVTGRTSNALTIAPIFLAVWIAARPATPAPSTRTLAGATFPAAVICPAKKRGNSCEASTMALYPAMFACEERISYVCARDNMRGTQSRASTLVFCAVRLLYSSVLMAGDIIEMRVFPATLSSSEFEGGRIWVRMLAAAATSTALASTFAPASS
mmetsp:Transcript_30675/g.60734  ORF Transcript_30675/g.60734 Transcript_30675/m.60734 type:complete len:228 (-) Transcript_30675:528-1211(-)